MSNSNPTQCERIIKYIRDFNSISTAEAYLDLGVMRLGARVSEIRKKRTGLENDEFLKTNWEKGTNRYGEKIKYARYTIEKVGGKEDEQRKI